MAEMNDEPQAETIPEHLYTLLCEYVWEGQAGKQSYMGLFGDINLSKFPGGLPVFFIVSAWRTRNSYGKSIVLEIQNEDETWVQRIGHGTFDTLPSEDAMFAAASLLQIPVAGLEFPSPDNYYVVVRIDGVARHYHPFTVTEVERPS